MINQLQQQIENNLSKMDAILDLMWTEEYQDSDELQQEFNKLLKESEELQSKINQLVNHVN